MPTLCSKKHAQFQMGNRIRRNQNLKTEEPLYELWVVNVAIPHPCAVGGCDVFADVVQHRQEETAGACSGVED